MNIVREMFNEDNASLVAKIPLSRKSKPDKLIWMDSITSVFQLNLLILWHARYYEDRRSQGTKRIRYEE